MTDSFLEEVVYEDYDLNDEPDELAHEGVLRRSGRYPWGSGETPYQRHKGFLQHVEDLQKQGLSETEIAKGLGISTTELRAAKSIAKNAKRAEDASQAQRLKDEGNSNVAIGRIMQINESSVRALLEPSSKVKNDQLTTTANVLKDHISKDKYLDFGEGTENHLGVSKTQLMTAVAMLKEEGYTVHYVKVQQLGTGKYTTLKVLAPPETPYSEVFKNQERISPYLSQYSEDGGTSFRSIQPPKSIDSKRVGVRYGNEGGAEKDGVIELRRGVDDISLGAARYAQVRIMVDGTHYLKGMAMYSDKLPDGVDMMFNTNKERTANKLDAMKPIKKEKDGSDSDLPFGSITRQKHYTDANGKEQLSLLNIVGTPKEDGTSIAGEEGAWSKWSRTLSSQMLSKQTSGLAKQQLGLSYEIKKNEFEEIMSLTNPTVRQMLLEKFADGADSSAVHLKAAGLPRTRSHVILPINSLKDNEIYAPNYRNGEQVVLIRHPHGGRFEIPELTVNNRNREANSLIKQAKDAVGINAKVAERLSGADFDGDTVLVIPNNHKLVKTKPPLEQLKNFDPKRAYPAYEGMKKMSARTKQLKMGDVSNLITDMTIKGASESDLAKAVKHSMVVIDAEKHNLNWKQSAIDNDIAGLKKKYQGDARAGASTLISKASSEIRVGDRKLRSAGKGGPIDTATGQKMYEYSNESYVNKHGKTVVKTVKSTKMAEAADARSLSSGTPMEEVYAEHANKLKSLGNTARKAALATKPTPYSPSAKKAYANEVSTLQSKLNVALKNKPLERQAQLLANTMVTAKRQANPDMEADELKKVKALALTEARIRTGAKKSSIEITPTEWAAIQSGAISTNKLKDILANTDLDRVKALATPRERPVMTDAKLARAKAMLAAGYDQAEIADALGVATSTLNDSIS